MQQTRVHFVIDKELDKKNIYIGLNSYKRRLANDFKQQKDERYESWLVLPQEEMNAEIEAYLATSYGDEHSMRELVFACNNFWASIEHEYFARLERVHDNHPFVEDDIKGVLSYGDRFGYNPEGRWFAVNARKDAHAAANIAMHELMHFMFHRYYEKYCVERGLNPETVWDVKEAFTVLLNIEFGDLRSQPDKGYEPHQALRAVVEQNWQSSKNFQKTLDVAIETVLKE